MNHKSYTHFFLVALLLLGILLVIGSFSSEAPKPASAASTPGEQSAALFLQRDLCNGSFEDEICSRPRLDVIYTGELRTVDGNLVKSDTQLAFGDKVNLKIIENALFVSVGGFYDTPPAPWVGGVGGEQCRFVPEFALWTTPDRGENEYFCIFVDKPAVFLSLSGLNCDVFSSVEIAKGLREINTSCTVTTSGPVANISANISATNVYDAGYVLQPYIGYHNLEAKERAYDLRYFGIINATVLAWNLDVVPSGHLPSVFTLFVNSTGVSSAAIISPDTCGGVNCGGITNYLRQNIPDGTGVTLSAQQVSGFTFSSWTGCNSISGNNCVVIMDSNKTVTANYISLPFITSLSCSVSPSAILTGKSALWTAHVSGGTAPYTFIWTSNNAEGPSGTGNTKNVTYNQEGVKTASVTVVDSVLQSFGPVACGNTLTVRLPECGDGIDNIDPEDESPQDPLDRRLIDCQDPACHTDGNPNNPDSCDPTIDDETDSTFREIFLPFRKALAMLFGF